ncbi:aldo/keto reductase [Colletotrichum graminicola]|uniref:Aldo/keto reductase n=1 Tax=Colletotrichum graminicola (strain M1.001 / M2 / FGSC 10212) TaxID=645133 RepID=E3QZV9_COLGM|nr:aldo/keto reductase [Colletotrichum graminicola M1.001]EFQ36397.1 aldo/keto reductase [Colletotrichum graminicola M1.001]WDK18407.1 aldo/keto reductase [Colletotrichum graminicola]
MAHVDMSISSTVSLRNGKSRMPILGYGEYQISKADCTRACLHALSAGYRHIDTAQLYNNEEAVGAVLQQSGLPREKIFVTTKIRYPRLGKGKTHERALQSVHRIDPRPEGYVDLFLIHSPDVLKPKGRRELRTALKKLYENGRARAIGMRSYATIWPPAVNQILLHPWTQQRETVEDCCKHGIVLQAFSPLARGVRLQDPTVAEIAARLAKTVAQVLIRYSLQKGWAPLPKSENEARIKENADIFDFNLSENDMAVLNSLDRGRKPRFEYQNHDG